MKQTADKKELEDARRQLEEFTQRLHEKSLLLERLKEQAATAPADDEYREVVNELTRQTILTEDDWNRFRQLFEKIQPVFFPKLKTAFPDITVAELRIAALTLLQIDHRQMAAMLGISTDSVRKSRQRLRQRLHIGTLKSSSEGGLLCSNNVRNLYAVNCSNEPCGILFHLKHEPPKLSADGLA